MAGGVSVTGLSSGLDTGSIVSKLMELKRRPIDIISAKKDSLDVQLSELQSLNTRLLAFQSVSKSLSTKDKFLDKIGSFSNNNAFDNNKIVSLTASSTAASGSFSLVVNSLAKAEKEIAQGLSSLTSSISTGVFSIKVGSTTTNITIDSSNNTLAGLKEAINTSGIDATATIINDGSGNAPYRLVVTSKNAGKDDTLFLSHTGRNILGDDPLIDGAILNFTESQSASDASFTLDGISITKAGNTVTDVIEGVTIDLESIGSGTITIDSDVGNVETNIETFVSEYNEIASFINDQLFIDTASGETGILFANPAVVSLQNTMREIISLPIPALTGTFTALSQIGITTSVTGFLEIDSGALTDAISEDIDAVSKLFIGFGSSDTSGLTFVGFSEDTGVGEYRVRVLDGQVQIAEENGSFQDASGSNTIFSGVDGTVGDDLTFQLNSLTDGFKGTITLSAGVAVQFERALDNLTEMAKQGPLKSEIDTLTTNISDIEDSIEDQEGRLAITEKSLVKSFTSMEIQVTLLQAQGDFLAQSQFGIFRK